MIRFDDKLDALLLNEVIARNPYAELKQGPVWIDIALAVTRAVNKEGITCDDRRAKERTKLVLKKHKGEDVENLKASGIDEDYTQVTKLCIEVLQLQEEGARLVAEKKAEKKSKKAAITAKRDKEAGVKDASMTTVTAGSSKENVSVTEGSKDADESSSDVPEDEGDKEPKKKRARTSKAAVSLNIAEMLQVKITREADNESKRLELQERALKLREDQMKLIMANPHLMGQGGAMPAFNMQQPHINPGTQGGNAPVQDAGGSTNLTTMQPVQPFDHYMKFY